MHERDYLVIILTLLDIKCDKIAIISRGERGLLPIMAYADGAGSA